jgi:drug/metabolite transporter (DMT)-like permease
MNSSLNYQLPSRQFGADALIFLNTLFWGLAYIVVKDAIGKVDYFVFLNQRFTLAFLLSLPFCLLWGRDLNRQVLFQGLVMGVLLFASYSSLTAGLQYTTATNSSFLTSLHVVFVPFVGAFFYKESLTPGAKWGCLLCITGLFLLCTKGTCSLDSFNQGELWIVFSALCIALRITYTSRFVQKSSIYWLTAIQLGTVSVLTAFGVILRGQPLIAWHPEVAWELAFCAILATVFAFLILNSMQRYTTPVHVALILCMEPVFTAFFGYCSGKETLTLMASVGAGLVLLGMVVSEVPYQVLREKVICRLFKGTHPSLRHRTHSSPLNPGTAELPRKMP